MKIYQFLETFSDADAIGYHVLGIDRLLKNKGIETGIYTNNIDEKSVGIAKYYRDFEGGDEDTILLFHHSIGSDVFDYIKCLDGVKKLIFHNITPPAYFKNRPDFMKMLEKGYRQMSEFDRVFTNATCDSDFNKKILKYYGYQNEITVIPPFVNLTNKFGVPEKKRKSKRYKILYVSQIAPHKNQKKLVKIFNTYQKYFNKNSELYIVGGFCLQDPYYKELLAEVSKNNSIYLTGKISLAELKSLYESSHLFLSMSEHEGFSVPLVEAMYFSLPIIAYKTEVVADTLKSGGILLESDDPLVVAVVIDKVKKDMGITEKIKANQNRVMKAYSPLSIKSILSRWLLKN